MRTKDSARFIAMVVRGYDNLSMSYGRAARLILDSGRHPEHRHGVHLDLPTFYLVRHSVELALKELLWAYHEREVAQARLDACRNTQTTAKPLPPEVVKDLDRTHLLGWLLLQMPAVAPSKAAQWRPFVERINELEEGHPEWSEYHRPKRGDPFERPVEIPVKDLVEKLEAFLKEAVLLNFDEEHDPKSWSVLQDLLVDAEALDQQLMVEEGR